MKKTKCFKAFMWAAYTIEWLCFGWASRQVAHSLIQEGDSLRLLFQGCLVMLYTMWLIRIRHLTGEDAIL